MSEEFDNLTPEQAERERVSSILKLSAQYANSTEIAAMAVDDGWDVQKAELEMLRASRPQGPSNIHTQRSSSNRGSGSASMLEASLLLRGGFDDVAVKAYGESTVQAAHDLRINNLVDLCAASLSMQNRDVPRGHDETIRAAFSTVSLPNILSNVTGRTLVAAYEEMVTDIMAFATIKRAANFKPQKSIRPSSLDTALPLGPDGEIKHASFGEEATYDWQLGTRARMVGVTRTDIINDDLSFFDDVAPMLGTSCARALLDLFWSTVLGGEAAGFFHGDNDNLLTTGSVLGITTLATGIQTFREQRDSKGNNVAIKPYALAVPPALETLGRTLLNSTEIVSGSDSTQPSGNPVAGIVQQFVTDARMSNTDKFTGASDASWYLFGGPMSHAVLVGFLNGKRTPTVEVEQADFNTLGIQMRTYFDFAVALGDPKAALKATGAGGGG